MAKAFFYFENREKIVEVPNELIVLKKALDILFSTDFDGFKYEETPFKFCYDFLIDRCVEIALKHFKFNKEDYDINFVNNEYELALEIINCNP